MSFSGDKTLLEIRDQLILVNRHLERLVAHLCTPLGTTQCTDKDCICKAPFGAAKKTSKKAKANG